MIGTFIAGGVTAVTGAGANVFMNYFFHCRHRYDSQVLRPEFVQNLPPLIGMRAAAAIGALCGAVSIGCNATLNTWARTGFEYIPAMLNLSGKSIQKWANRLIAITSIAIATITSMTVAFLVSGSWRTALCVTLIPMFTSIMGTSTLYKKFLK
jgi:hypothetical protein